MTVHTEIPTCNNICALVISYHPHVSIAEKLFELARQVKHIVIVDNASNVFSKVTLASTVEKITNVHIIYNKINVGQAAALNIGIEYIQKSDYKWILTLDQDSLISERFVKNMAETYQMTNAEGLIGSICPILSSYDGIHCPKHEDIMLRTFSGAAIEGRYSFVQLAITSGNLINIDLFRLIGIFEEGFFIDYVDQEFSLRLGQAGYKILQCNNTVLYHNIGNTTVHSFFGKPTLVANNSSVRSYYYYRNGIMVYKRYFLRNFRWVLRDVIKGFTFNFVKILLFESDRRNKLRKIFLGIAHGFSNRIGPYNDSRKSI